MSVNDFWDWYDRVPQTDKRWFAASSDGTAGWLAIYFLVKFVFTVPGCRAAQIDCGCVLLSSIDAEWMNWLSAALAAR